MAKVCFVSFEIHPTVKGGCGVLLNNAARILLSQGHEVIFLLDLNEDEFEQFDQVDRLALPRADHCRAYRVQNLLKDVSFKPADFRSVFEYRSHRFNFTARQVYQFEHPDVIEFFEYTGSAYSALCTKAAGLDYQDTLLSVRLHGSLELIDRQQPGSFHGIDRYIMYGLEHQALRLAEAVLVPSHSFYEKAYVPHYETWFGEVIVSKPPLVDYPRPRDQAGALMQAPLQDVILFYGRLQGIKGVDVFVDAAILYLSNSHNPPRQFYLVGYDSYLPPGGGGSYQDYLLRKIPAHLRPYFHFSGQLSWDELGQLIERTLFGVIPSYFESFCYAAHELYQAGVPLILSDIPAFQDYFEHERNALLFDGSTNDLAVQITRLNQDAGLRKRLSCPYPLNLNPLGEYYESLDHASTAPQSWMTNTAQRGEIDLLVIVICDQPNGLPATLQALAQALQPPDQVLIAYPAARRQVKYPPQAQPVMAWFLGANYVFEDRQGNAVNPTAIHTSQALILLKAGDLVESRYLESARDTLQRLPQINYVGCWQRELPERKAGQAKTTSGFPGATGRLEPFKLEAMPVDAIPELFPYLSRSTISRFVLRTRPGLLLIDLFDARAGQFGEIAYLWGLDTRSLVSGATGATLAADELNASCGLIVPEPWLSCWPEKKPRLDSNALDYLLIRHTSPRWSARLARMPLILSERDQVLRRHLRSEALDQEQVHGWRAAMRYALQRVRMSRLNHWLGNLPWLKDFLKKIMRPLLH